ncbi:Probable DNA helicase MPN_340 [Geodia barretti]|uniref:DNA 3'-5' helicase n=1 Tax=Geodia barretti TaxID=519541 RepID=A0AA35REG5_GEOBA|nr:Probable DNA helicase MPN_340 [Geodia barretti]
MKLDRNQEKAVNHVTGPAIVIAGPGSGKTTVVTARILNLIQTHNIPPSQILAIAFNRKAVEEMETRILRELASSKPSHETEKHQKPEIRTLHAFGKDIITENYERAGFNQEPDIWTGQIDEIIAQEQTQIERDASTISVAIYKIENKRTGKCYIGQTTNPDRRRKEHFDHSSNDRLRQAIRSEGETQFSFEVLERVPGRKANRREAHWIASYRNRGGVFNRADPLRVQYSNQVILEMFCQHFEIPYKEHLDRDPDFENLRDRFNDIKETVMRAKRHVTTGLFDPTTLNDPVVQAFAVKYETLKTEANAVDFEDMIIHAANLLKTCPDLRQTYRDKYPYLLVDEFQDIAPADFRLIKLLSENLFAVGDDDQAIYGFRGGDSEIMQAFTDQRDVAKYEIARNYRSTSTIVEHARALIERNEPRISKNLRAHNPLQQEIKIVKTTPETVETILRRELKSSQEIAVLARTNYEIDQIQGMLTKHAHPVEVTTIHKAKGREWEKVILIHNTLERRFPRRDNKLAEERRVFYVAMTRAKVELVVLGGMCPFVPEFEKIPKNAGYYLRKFAYWCARRRLKKEKDVK